MFSQEKRLHRWFYHKKFLRRVPNENNAFKFSSPVGVMFFSRADAPGTQKGSLAFEEGIVLEYRIIPFDKAKFREVSGRIGPVYGVDGGGAPATRLEKLSLIRGKARISLEVSGMYDPALGGMDKKRFNLRIVNPRSMVLTGVFSDAAGSYAAQWLIVDGIGIRTLLSDDPDTVSRLIKP